MSANLPRTARTARNVQRRTLTLSQSICPLRGEISSMRARARTTLLLIPMLSCHEGAIGNLQVERQAPAAEKKCAQAFSLLSISLRGTWSGISCLAQPLLTFYAV
jgi:hypothetical protein